MLFPPRIEQYARNQEAGKDKEQVHAALAQLDEPRVLDRRCGAISSASKSIQRHDDNRQPADRVQRRNVSSWQFQRGLLRLQRKIKPRGNKSPPKHACNSKADERGEPTWGAG